MPWCPNCKTEYIAEIAHCADCGQLLVHEDPSPPVEPKPQGLLLDGVIAGFTAGFISWAILFVFVFLATGPRSSNNDSQISFFFPICLSVIIFSVSGFWMGQYSKIAFLSILIGWLMLSAPLLMLGGIAYAHDCSLTNPAGDYLGWAVLGLSIVNGAISTAAGSILVKNRRVSLALWLMPTGIVIIGLIIAAALIQ